MREMIRQQLKEPARTLWLNTPTFQDPVNKLHLHYRKVKTRKTTPSNRQSCKKKRK